jgi:hypothetical protein
MHNICRRHGRRSPGEEVKWLVAYLVAWLVAGGWRLEAGGWRHWCNQSCVGEREKVEEKKLRKIGIGGRKWFFCRL